MKNQLFLIAVFITCAAFSCKKGNDVGTVQSAQNEKVLSAIEGKSYRLSAYYSMDAAGTKADLTSQVACIQKDTIYFSSAKRNNGNLTGELLSVEYTVYTYCDPASCYFSSQYNARKYPSAFTRLSMDDGIFGMPFPLNQVKFTSYPPNGIKDGQSGVAREALYFKDVDASNRLVLYYDGIDNKTYYVELSRV